ncbi:MAG: hypothetical protein HQ562_08375 [Candidatus Marinimicrobia bacterium]|nr:hypothetical protein [Candidatus Neomarinimicrobiota bacterium]
MNKKPSFQFYPADWIKDPKLSMCSPETRGVWIDLLCAMHELDRCGEVSGTPAQLCRICRCDQSEFERAIAELESTKTATVTKHNGIITIINRRMNREHKERINNKVRQKRFRVNRESNKKVTIPSSSSTSKTPISPLEFEELWKAYPGTSEHKGSKKKA